MPSALADQSSLLDIARNCTEGGGMVEAGATVEAFLEGVYVRNAQ